MSEKGRAKNLCCVSLHALQYGGSGRRCSNDAKFEFRNYHNRSELGSSAKEGESPVSEMIRERDICPPKYYGAREIP